MKRILVVATLGCSLLAPITSHASFSELKCAFLRCGIPDVEEMLERYNSKDAEARLKQLLNEGELDRDKFFAIMGLLNTGLISGLADLEAARARYLSSSQSDISWESLEDIFKRLDEAVNSGNAIPMALGHLSEKFSDFLVGRIRQFGDTRSNLVKIRNDELKERNQQLKEARKKELEERFAEARELQARLDAERERQEAESRKNEAERVAAEKRAKEAVETQERHNAAMREARETSQYRKFWYETTICCAIQDKAYNESELKSDSRYAKKYGLVITRRADTVDQIKYDDQLITEGKKEYRQIFGKSFSATSCKKVDCENSEEQLDSLAQGIAVRIPPNPPIDARKGLPQ